MFAMSEQFNVTSSADEDYSENCLIYDSSSADPFAHVKEKIDVFVIYHLMGWFVKSFIYRNVYVSIFASQIFELMEYTSKHHMQNFAECWWDSVTFVMFYITIF